MLTSYLPGWTPWNLKKPIESDSIFSDLSEVISETIAPGMVSWDSLSEMYPLIDCNCEKTVKFKQKSTDAKTNLNINQK